MPNPRAPSIYRRRAIQATLLISLLFLGARWLYSVPTERVTSNAQISHPLRVGQPYVVNESNGRQGFVIPLERDARYVLVIGSLGDPAREYEVKLSSAPATSLRPLPATVVETGPGRLPAVGRFNSTLASSRGDSTHVREDASVDRESYEISEISNSGHENARCDGDSDTDRTFHLHITNGPLDNPRHYVAIKARPVARGERVRVYLDRAIIRSKRIRETAHEIVRVMEREILPTTDRIVGRHRDIDGDRFLTVMLTPWLGRLQGGKTSLGGLVRSADFDLQGESPFSNRSDMLFLNSSITPGPHLKALLAHEYTHVLAFSFPKFLNGRPTTLVEEDWLNEGLAHVFERQHRVGWSNLGHRVFEFLSSPQKYPLVVPDYFASGQWRNHGCRGATFLFLEWCADRYGERFLRRLLRSPRTGIANLEASTGRRFEDLFREWSVTTATVGKPYRSIDLHGQCGEFDLHGVQRVRWPIGEKKKVTLRGTSFICVEVTPGRLASTIRRLRVTATPGARLQITLVKNRESR